MKVKKAIYIISFADYTAGEDANAAKNQILYSAQSYYFKYRARDQGVEIFWYSYIGDAFYLQASYTENHEGELEDQFDDKILNPSEGKTMAVLLKDIKKIEKTSNNKQYKNKDQLVDYGALIVAHGSTNSDTNVHIIGGMIPENFAELLAKNTIKNTTNISAYEYDKNIFPIFGKIVFNVCHTAKQAFPSDPTDWVKEANRSEARKSIYDKENRIYTPAFKKWNKDKSGPEPTPPAIANAPGARYYMKPRYPDEKYETEPYLQTGEMNMLCRFLARYYKLIRPEQNIMVAGYDNYVTGRHPDKLKGDKATTLSQIGSKNKAPNTKKKFYSATMADGEISLVTINEQGWSDQVRNQ